MEYALKERIGNPELFTGRKEDLDFFLKWIDGIKEEKSQSTAILARRKMGKTALIERLFNITFFRNEGIIPFYYEIKEIKMWMGDFCKEFFLTFIYQYIAFKTRKEEYLYPMKGYDFKKAVEIAKKEGVDYLIDLIEGVEHEYRHEYVDTLWTLVRDAPRWIAARQDEFIVQMIDEFQFLNAMIYRDKAMKFLVDDMAGGYLGTAESKIAPLLVSGSWVSWLMEELDTMLPNRFIYHYLENMPEDEAIEMVYKYSRFFEVPISEETAYLIDKISAGSPFYMSSILRSRYKHKNLTTIQGLTDTLEYETLDRRGNIKSTWMEYVASAFKKVNGKNAKAIVLYLCRYRDREITRAELLEKLSLDIDDTALEKRLKALVRADIIDQGSTDFRYRGINDNIFDKVFRGVYQEEIEKFDIEIIGKEYRAQFEKLKKDYLRLLGKLNCQKGYFAEYLILNRLQLHARTSNELLKSVTRYLPEDFNFCEYSRVWRYDSSPVQSRGFNVDIFARTVTPDEYSIIGEVKSRDTRKFSKTEVMAFERKYVEVRKIESIDRAVGFIFSRSGFTKEAEDYCKEKGIACSDSEIWLGD